MKKIMTGVTMFLMTMAILLPSAKAQKTPFTGTVVYDVSLSGDVPDQAKSMMPTEMTLKATPDKMITVLHSSMMDIKNIFDAPTQVSNMLMNMMGQKLNIKQTAAQLVEERKKMGIVITVKPTSDTKTIAGHNCKRAIMTMKSNQSAEKSYDVFYTDEFDISKFSFGKSLPEVDGLPLEFSFVQGPFALKMVARSIKNENVAASEFVIPADYKQVTQEELRSMFGGGGQ